MNKSIRYALVLLGLLSCCVSLWAAETVNPFLGRWALTIPGGAAGWLSVEQKEGYLDASILWGGGSVVPVDFVTVDEGNLIVTRNHRIERKDADGKVVRTQTLTEGVDAHPS
jgi:hypothetical protein